MRYCKTIIIFLFVLNLFFPLESLALDQRCFTKKTCVARRIDMGVSNQEAAEGFLVKPKECGVSQSVDSSGNIHEDELGFCLPAGKTKAQVGIAGKRTFENIGEYIKYGYQYAIQAAAVLAVLMIIIAGFQWTASGGNTATIGSAKKRITGALIGLVIAVGSYTIIQTIDPKLTELRLPEVWLINAMPLSPIYCDEINNANLALALTMEEKKSLSTEEQSKFKQQRAMDTKFDIDPKNNDVSKGKLAECGNEYFMQGFGTLTCIGTACGKDGRVCHKRLWEEDTKYACYEASLAGNVYSQSGGGTSQGAMAYLASIINDGWEWGSNGWIPEGGFSVGLSSEADFKGFYPVCKYNGIKNALSKAGSESVEIKIVEDPRTDSDNFNPDTFSQFYAIKVESSELNKTEKKLWNEGGCAGEETDGTPLGYVLVMEFNEEGDPTDEVHFLGREGHQIVDLGKIPTGADFDGDLWFKIYNLTGCVTERVPQYLFTREELEKGLRLDINVDKIEDQDDDPEDLAEYYKVKADEWLTIYDCYNYINHVLED